MRYITITAIIILFTLLLSTCSAQAQPYGTADAKALIDAGVFSGVMLEVNGSAIPALYGVAEEAVEDCVSYRAADTAVSADEVTVLVLRDEEAAKAAEETCRERVDSLIENCETYAPAAVPRLKAAVIDRVGATVLLAVGDPDRLPDAVGNLHE